MPDLLFILALALVIFGPKKLPALTRQLGMYQAQFRRMKRELTAEIEAEMNKVRIAEEGGPAAGETIASAAQTVIDSKLA